jgi:hypothetical protein
LSGWGLWLQYWASICGDSLQSSQTKFWGYFI